MRVRGRGRAWRPATKRKCARPELSLLASSLDQGDDDGELRASNSWGWDIWGEMLKALVEFET